MNIRKVLGLLALALLISTPIAIFVSSSGSVQRVAHQRQKATTSTSVTALITASNETIQVIGIAKPKKVSWNVGCAQTR